MAKAKRFWYECVLQCDLGFLAPDQRRERWTQRGKVEVQPPRTLHSVRLYPSKGYDKNGNYIPGDVAVFDQPLARRYTEEIEISVSRPLIDAEHPGGHTRYMRPKVTKVKFVLLDPEDVTESVKRRAYDYGPDWHPSLFAEGPVEINLPRDVAVGLAAEKVG